jgi:hypothetical protein
LGQAQLPDVDCVGDGTGGIACTGTNLVGSFVAYGATATVATSTLLPQGNANVLETGFNAKRYGHGNVNNIYYYNASTTPCAGDFTACVVFRPLNDGGILGDTQGSNGYALIYNLAGASIGLYTSSALGNSSTFPTGYVDPGNLGVFCGSYHGVTDGTSIVSVNLNGTTGSRTNSHLMGVQTNGLGIGAIMDGWSFTGAIYRATQWCGWAATAGQEATMVDSQTAQVTQRPNSVSLLETRSTSEYCQVTTARGPGWITGVTSNRICVTENGLQVFPAYTNNILYSDDASQAAWTAATSTKAAQTITVPTGISTTASLITDTTDNDLHGVTQAYTATAADWTASVYIKPGTLNWIGLTLDNTNIASFDTTACVTGTAGTGNVTAATLTAGGWCRIGVRRLMTAGAATMGIYLGTADNTFTYAGTATGTASFWGVNLLAASFEGPQVHTDGTAVAVSATKTKTPNAMPFIVPHCTAFTVAFDPLDDLVYRAGTYNELVSIKGSNFNDSEFFYRYGATIVYEYHSHTNQQISIVYTSATPIGTHRWAMCIGDPTNAQGTLALYRDNVSVGSMTIYGDCTAGGCNYAGNPSTLYLYSPVGTQSATGYISNVKQCESANPIYCQASP